ncbi:MAG: energy transducer TonB [Bacteroidota bacterium]|nr:energy transducer TonB [Bacteroidota bacterium]
MKKTIIILLLLFPIVVLGQSRKTKYVEISIDTLYHNDFYSLVKSYPGLMISDEIEFSEKLPKEITETFQVKYPKKAKENGIQGSVHARYIISGGGEMIEIKIIKGLGGGLSEEVERVLTEMSKQKFKTLDFEGVPIPLYHKFKMDFILK